MIWRHYVTNQPGSLWCLKAPPFLDDPDKTKRALRKARFGDINQIQSLSQDLQEGHQLRAFLVNLVFLWDPVGDNEVLMSETLWEIWHTISHFSGFLPFLLEVQCVLEVQAFPAGVKITRPLTFAVGFNCIYVHTITVFTWVPGVPCWPGGPGSPWGPWETNVKQSDDERQAHTAQTRGQEGTS